MKGLMLDFVILKSNTESLQRSHTLEGDDLFLLYFFLSKSEMYGKIIGLSVNNKVVIVLVRNLCFW